jgi:hypothetical protein
MLLNISTDVFISITREQISQTHKSLPTNAVKFKVAKNTYKCYIP